MEGVRTVWRAKQEFKYIIDKTYSALQDVQESLNGPYKYLDNLNSIYKGKGKPSTKLEACLTDIASAVSTVSEYTDLMRGIDDEYKMEVLDKMEAMEQERIQLTERIRLLEKEKADLKEELKKKDQSLLDISHTIAKFNDSMEIFNTRVNSAVNQIACKEYMQSDEFKNKDRKGVKAPRYRQDVDNDAIIAKYESGTSVKKLAEQYKMTENGMRFRLKELGVWKDRRYKK